MCDPLVTSTRFRCSLTNHFRDVSRASALANRVERELNAQEVIVHSGLGFPVIEFSVRGEDSDRESLRQLIRETVARLERSLIGEPGQAECSASIAHGIIADPCATYWLKEQVRRCLTSDPVDALADAEALVALLRQRVAEGA